MSDFEKKMEEKFNEEIKNIHKANIMIVGGTGVGKSSLINKIFGSSVAKVGSGIPVTKGIKEFSNDYWGIRIFDTEGYEIIDGKINNDNFQSVVIKEIKERKNKILDQQIHIFWYCLSAANHRITHYDIDNIKYLKEIGINLSIVITKCDVEEIDDNGNGLVSIEFKKELLNQGITCKVFETITNGDDTLGLNSLLEWSSEKLPNEDLKHAFISSQINNIPLKDQSAKNIIHTASIAAGGAAGLNPIPMSDSLIIAPIQIGMAVKLAKLYGFDNLGNHTVSLLKSQLLGLLGKQIAASLTKLIPVLGQAVNASIAAALTASLGYALMTMYRSAYLDYLQTGKIPDIIQLFESLDLSAIFENLKLKKS